MFLPHCVTSRRSFLRRAAGAAAGVFNTTRREAYVKRGPAGADGWTRFGFADGG